MVFNCYFPTEPDMYQWCFTNVFDRLVRKLRIHYPQYTFNIIHGPGYGRQLGIVYDKPGKKYGYSLMILECEATKKYHLINYTDLLTDINSSKHWDVENLVDIYSSTGAHQDTIYFKPLDVEYVPTSYTVHSTQAEFEISISDTNFKSKDLTKGLFFRGNTYDFRSYLLTDKRFNIVPTSIDNKLSKVEYIKELNTCKISLSLDGVGEVTHRDIESFGTGAAVIRKVFTNRFHNPLIPGFHYIGITTDDIEDLPKDQYYKALADKFYDKYLKVKDDNRYLKFIAQNGLEWYKNNGTVDANVNILLKLLNLSKLF